MRGDVEIRITRGAGDRGVPITPDRLRTIHRDIRKRLRQEMVTLAKFLKTELIWAYQKAIRVEGRDKESMLWPKLQQAMQWDVSLNENDIMMGVFDLAFMDRETRGQGKKTESRGWFLLYEDGRMGRNHGSRTHTFVTVDEAIHYATDCANHFGLEGQERQEWLDHIQEVFAGRYGEGIMVRNNAPLFFRYPTYGSDNGEDTTAADVLNRSGHPGYYAWNVLSKVGGAMAPRGRYQQGRDSWLYDIVERAVYSAMMERYNGN